MTWMTVIEKSPLASAKATLGGGGTCGTSGVGLAQPGVAARQPTLTPEECSVDWQLLGAPALVGRLRRTSSRSPGYLQERSANQ